jgi:hypothetical protein
LQINSTGAVTSNGSNATGLGHNYYFDGSNNRYLTTGAANLFLMINNEHRWYTAPSGTAGNAISFTQAMTLTAAGDLGVGTTSPNGRIQAVGAANADCVLRLNTSTNAYASGVSLIATDSNGARFNFINASYGAVENWYIGGNGVDRTLVFKTDSTERARIDSSGNLQVGVNFGTCHRIVKDAAGAQCLDVINSSTTAGSRSLEIGLATNADATGSFIRCGDAGAIRLQVLGNGNVQNVNNSYGPISDIKLKENIVDATPKLEKLLQVRIVNYNLKADLGYESYKQIGVIAQELEQVFPGLVDESPDIDKEGNDLCTTTKSVKMSVFVPMLIKAMQEQQALIQTLTARVAALESN